MTSPRLAVTADSQMEGVRLEMPPEVRRGSAPRRSLPRPTGHRAWRWSVRGVCAAVMGLGGRGGLDEPGNRRARQPSPLGLPELCPLTRDFALGPSTRKRNGEQHGRELSCLPRLNAVGTLGPVQSLAPGHSSQAHSRVPVTFWEHGFSTKPWRPDAGPIPAATSVSWPLAAPRAQRDVHTWDRRRQWAQ